MVRFVPGSVLAIALGALLAGCPTATDPTTDTEPDEYGTVPPVTDDYPTTTTDSTTTGDTGPPGPPAELLDPISTTAPPWPTRTHPQPPSAFWDDGTGPLPTNAWWQRLTLGGGTAAIHPMPYQVQLDDSGLRASYALPITAEFEITLPFEDDVTFGATEPLGSRAVIDYDPLSVTVQWTASSGNTMTAPVVRGMPYVTAQYAGHTPVIRGPVQTINGEGVPTSATGTRFELGLGAETWVLYASSEITFSAGVGALVATAPFTGSLRAAVLTDDHETILDTHAARIPTGGSLEAEASGNEGTLVFAWEAEGAGDLLMMRLPHHGPVLQKADEPGIETRTLRGTMVGVTGDRWEMTEPLTTIGFEAPSGIDPTRVEAVRTALKGDIGLGVPSQDPYFGGKELARLGRLALIADELGETSLATQYRTKLKAALEPWLDGTNRDPLVYDSTWGGAVVASGLANPGAAFGQAYYNDHHFHYGYHVYAAAAVAAGEPAWVNTWGDAVDHLIRDYANPSAADPSYTPFRNKDWFVGHSWAAGLFDFERNHESTSEAVNAYYAIALWGEAQGDDRIRDLGRLLLATEMRAAQTYWHIESGSPIYTAPFANNRVVGILYDRRAVYNTFFGFRPEFIHGIQWLPFTPITEALLTPSWMAEAYPVASSGLGAPDLAEGWRGFLIMGRGINDPDAAWTDAQTLSSYDNGNSRTNTLYWLATRP